MTEQMTPEQEQQLKNVFNTAIDSMNLSTTEADGIIKNNQTLFSGVQKILQELVEFNTFFGPAVCEFEIKLPTDHTDTKLRVPPLKRSGIGHAHTVPEIPQHTLESGKTYRVKLFPILNDVTNENCVKFHRTQSGIFVGMEGLVLVHNLNREALPADRFIVSLEEHMPEQFNQVSYMFTSSNTAFKFAYGSPEADWCKGCYLLCLCEH
jgi:hypothetical protein